VSTISQKIGKDR
jgi:hypothetical protein